MRALAVDDKRNVYAEIDLDKDDRTAIPAGCSLVGETLWSCIQAAVKTADDAETITALGLTDVRMEREYKRLD